MAATIARGIELEVAAQSVAGRTVLSNFAWQDVEVESKALASNAAIDQPQHCRHAVACVARTGGRLWTAYDFQPQALYGWGGAA